MSIDYLIILSAVDMLFDNLYVIINTTLFYNVCITKFLYDQKFKIKPFLAFALWFRSK